MSTFAILPARASGQSELEGCGYLDTGGEREVLSDQSAAILVGLFHVRIVDPILDGIVVVCRKVLFGQAVEFGRRNPERMAERKLASRIDGEYVMQPHFFSDAQLEDVPLGFALDDKSVVAERNAEAALVDLTSGSELLAVASVWIQRQHSAQLRGRSDRVGHERDEEEQLVLFAFVERGQRRLRAVSDERGELVVDGVVPLQFRPVGRQRINAGDLRTSDMNFK